MGKKKKGRGSGTGRGSGKNGRGAGNRGGRGKAGMGKKAKHKKQSAEQVGEYLGEDGFNRPQDVVEETEAINLRDIDRNIDTFVAEGVAEESDGGYVFDAEAAGYDKVLGGGRLTRDIDVKAPEFSDSARRKIEDAGNEAVTDE